MSGVTPSVSENCWDVRDAWMTLREEYVARTYCIVSLSPVFTAAPVPVMRSLTSKFVGGAPGGTTTVGAVPNFPAGDGSVTAGLFTGVVVVVATVVVVDATVVVVDAVDVVVGVDFP